MTTIVAISAGLSDPSTTRLLADRLVESVQKQYGDASLEVVSLRELAHDITDATLTGFAAPRLQAVIDKVIAADGLIVVTPIYKASYPGLFKSFFDVLDADVLTGKPVLLAATGGTARHSLAVDFALRPLFAYMQALTVPTSVFASPYDWGTEGTNAWASALTVRLPSWSACSREPARGAVGPRTSTCSATRSCRSRTRRPLTSCRRRPDRPRCESG